MLEYKITTIAKSCLRGAENDLLSSCYDRNRDNGTSSKLIINQGPYRQVENRVI